MASEPPPAAPAVGGDGEPPLKDIDITDDGHGVGDGEDPRGTDGPGDEGRKRRFRVRPLDQPADPLLEVLPAVGGWPFVFELSLLEVLSVWCRPAVRCVCLRGVSFQSKQRQRRWTFFAWATVLCCSLLLYPA